MREQGPLRWREGGRRRDRLRRRCGCRQICDGDGRADADGRATRRRFTLKPAAQPMTQSRRCDRRSSSGCRNMRHVALIVTLHRWIALMHAHCRLTCSGPTNVQVTTTAVRLCSQCRYATPLHSNGDGRRRRTRRRQRGRGRCSWRRSSSPLRWIGLGQRHKYLNRGHGRAPRRARRARHGAAGGGGAAQMPPPRPRRRAMAASKAPPRGLAPKPTTVIGWGSTAASRRSRCSYS